METFKLLVELIQAVIWPATGLFVLIYFHKNFGASISSFLSNKKNIRARLGSAEIELHTVERLQEKITQIAEESDPKKRLEIAKKALAIDDAIRELNNKDIELLLKLDKDTSPSFLYWPYGGEEEDKSFTKLHKLNLVSSMQLTGGEEIGAVSAIGKQVLKKINEQEISNAES